MIARSMCGGKTMTDIPRDEFGHDLEVKRICFCDCGGYGTRTKFGRDEECPECGKVLDWTKEIEG